VDRFNESPAVNPHSLESDYLLRGALY